MMTTYARRSSNAGRVGGGGAHDRYEVFSVKFIIDSNTKAVFI